jgi:hypothetical protein
MKQIERRATGETTYGSDDVELADLRPPKRSLLERIFQPSEDPLSFAGSGAGHQFSRAFWAMVVGSVVVGGLSTVISKKMLASSEAAAQNYAKKYDLEIREQLLQTAQTTESILNTLSDQSIYLKDKQSGLIRLKPESASLIISQMEHLSSSWPGYVNNSEVKLILKLATEGITSKDLVKAYDGFVRKQQKRVKTLQFQPIDGAVSDLKEKFPSLPDLDSIPAL